MREYQLIRWGSIFAVLLMSLTTLLGFSFGEGERANGMVDLAVQDIWYDENLTVYCRIASLAAPYTGMFYVNLTVNDHPYFSEPQIMMDWTGFFNVTFQQRISWDGESVKVMVNVYDPQWKEDNDTSNDQRTEVWERNLPDLWIESVFTDQITGNATCLLQNHGEASTSSSFEISLDVNGTEISRVTVDPILDRRERIYVDLNWSWDRSVSIVNLVVEADPDDGLDESDESDNNYSITWTVIPELRITSGPEPEEVTQNTVSISWETSLPVDAVIEYGTSTLFGFTLETDSIVETGTFELDHLDPDTFYLYKIIFRDEYGRSVISTVRTFQTDSEETASETIGSFDMEKMMNLSGKVPLPFTCSDPAGIKKLDVYIDGKMVKSIGGMKKGTIDDMVLDLGRISAGNHTVMVEVKNILGSVRRFGSNMYVRKVIEPRNPRVEFDPGTDERSGMAYLFSRCRDPIGIVNVTWYLDGDVVEVDTPILSDRTLFMSYWNWDTTGVYDGTHTVAVMARNDEGNVTSTVREIDIHNRLPPVEPNVGVSRQQMRRTGSVITMPLRVGNAGPGAAENIYIEDIVKGFIPADEDMDSYRWTQDGRIWVVQTVIPRLEVGEYVTVEYKVVPAMLSEEEEHVIGYALNHPDDDTTDPVTTIIRYRGEGGSIRYVKTRNLPPQQFVGGLHMTTGAENAISYADYMILTCPYRLEENYGRSDAQDLLMTAAQLAAEKHGVLGFMVRSAYHGLSLSDTDVYTKLQEWSLEMNPAFTDYGYLAIIGENNIIPTWTYEDVVHFRGEDDPRDVPLSDHGYMNLEGGEIPTIAVGRFIGSDYDEIVAPMQVSLEESRGTLRNDHDGDALLISGAGNSVQSFKNYLVDLRSDINAGMDDVTLVEKSPSLIERSMSHYFDGNPAHLAAGNLDFDAEGEIVFTRLGYTAYVLEESGFTSDFYHFIEEGDVVLCGNIYGDNKDEIIFVETGTLDSHARAYNKIGDEQTRVTLPWESGDPICADDYDGDGMDELIMASASSDEVIVIDPVSGEIDRFSVEDVRPGDRIGIGDMDADSDIDVVIGDINDDMVRIYLGPDRTRFDIEVPDLDEDDAFSVGVYSGNQTGDRVFILHPEISGHTNEVSMKYDEDGSEWVGESPKSYMTPVDSGCAAVVTEFIGNGGYNEVILVEGGSVNNVRILDYEGCSGRFRAEINPYMDELDLIVYSDHGYTRGWSGTYHFDQVPGWGMNTWTHRPVIFSAACSTGDYTATDDSMAVSCLRNGAAVFIGATQTSQISENNLAMQFVSDYAEGVPIGAAFRNYKASLVSGDFGIRSNMARLWAYQYNLYGDPAFGTPTGAVPGRSGPADSRADGSGEIVLEEPEFLENAGEKEAILEGGLKIAEEGGPSIPYIRRTVDIPPGNSPVNVTLTRNSPWIYYRDLVLREYILGEFASKSCSIMALESTTDPDNGWYPSEHLDWEYSCDMAKNGTLILHIFPFQYDAGTFIGRFCPEWSLSYDLVESPVYISELTGPGTNHSETVSFTSILEPINGGGRVIITQRIVTGEGELITDAWATLPSQDIEINYTTEIDQDLSYPGPSGNFRYEIEILNEEGVLLDSASYLFRFGRAEIVVTEFEHDSNIFEENDTIGYRILLENIGDAACTGVLRDVLLDPETGSSFEFLRENRTIEPGTGIVSLESELDFSTLTGDSYVHRISFTSDQTSTAGQNVLYRNGTQPIEVLQPLMIVEYETTNRTFYEGSGIWINGTARLSNGTLLEGIGVGAWIGINTTSNTTVSGSGGLFSLYLEVPESGNWTVNLLVSAGVIEFEDSFQIIVLELENETPDDDDDVTDDDDDVDDDTPDDDDTDDTDPDDDVGPDKDDDDDTGSDDDAGKGLSALIFVFIVGLLVLIIFVVVVLVIARRSGAAGDLEEE